MQLTVEDFLKKAGSLGAGYALWRFEKIIAELPDLGATATYVQIVDVQKLSVVGDMLELIGVDLDNTRFIEMHFDDPRVVDSVTIPLHVSGSPYGLIHKFKVNWNLKGYARRTLSGINWSNIESANASIGDLKRSFPKTKKNDGECHSSRLTKYPIVALENDQGSEVYINSALLSGVARLKSNLSNYSKWVAQQGGSSEPLARPAGL